MIETLMTTRLLWIDDDVDFLASWHLRLKAQFRLSTSASLNQALEKLAEKKIDVVFLDLHLGGEDGLLALPKIKAASPDVPVVIVSGDRKTQNVVAAMQNGADDYLTKPFSKDELLATIHKIANLQAARARTSALLEKVLDDAKGKPGHQLIYSSTVMKNLLATLTKVKGHAAPILLEGPSGSGKELIARFIFEQEQNAKRPFIAINCAAIPENLVESEFFGHVKGSFSGAVGDKIGLFELAHGGDLFLDEIHALKPDIQVKLLRALQEKEFRPVGGTQNIQSDFRVIAATNKNLEALVQKNEFRLDLYYRLKVLHFKVPGLNERREEIPLFVAAFAKEFSQNGATPQFSEDAMQKLQAYPWPGHVRELKNVVQSLMILVDKPVIEACDLPKWLTKPVVVSAAESLSLPDNSVSLKDYLKACERAYIERVLRQNENRDQAAQTLGVSRATFYNKIKNLDLQ